MRPIPTESDQNSNIPIPTEDGHKSNTINETQQINTVSIAAEEIPPTNNVVELDIVRVVSNPMRSSLKKKSIASPPPAVLRVESNDSTTSEPFQFFGTVSADFGESSEIIVGHKSRSLDVGELFDVYRYAEPNTLNLASHSLICDSMDELEYPHATKRVQWDCPVSTMEYTTEKHCAVANIRLSSDKGIINCREKHEKDGSLYNGAKSGAISQIRENLFAFDDMENVEVQRPVVLGITNEENKENDQDVANQPTKITMSPAAKKGVDGDEKSVGSANKGIGIFFMGKETLSSKKSGRSRTSRTSGHTVATPPPSIVFTIDAQSVSPLSDTSYCRNRISLDSSSSMMSDSFSMMDNNCSSFSDSCNSILPVLPNKPSRHHLNHQATSPILSPSNKTNVNLATMGMTSSPCQKRDVSRIKSYSPNYQDIQNTSFMSPMSNISNEVDYVVGEVLQKLPVE